MVHYLLFENATGYALFERRDVEEIGQNLSKVQDSMQDFSRFAKLVSLKAFLPFDNPQTALENINDASEGVLNNYLRNFLEQNVGTGNHTLGVSESTLGSAIESTLHIKCERNPSVLELVRGVRLHFETYLKNASDAARTDDAFMLKSQRGLAHSYSRSRIKFNVNKNDNVVIQAISLLDQLDKDINTFAMRIREWYSWHFPELVRIVNDNILYARVARLLQNRANITEDMLEKLTAITQDEDKSKLILSATKSSMGYEVSEFDMKCVIRFADRVVSLAEYRNNLSVYLHQKMNDIAPNLTALVGEVVGARLINHAGSLTTLAKYPASTVQILGAEKALFRALKTRGNTPKYGLIFNSTFIGRAKPKDKGRISRYLANKCSIASRIDAFADYTTSKFGETLRDQVEERLKFYESGEAPPKNADVMHGVIQELKKDGIDVVHPTPAPAAGGGTSSKKRPREEKKEKEEGKSEKKKEKKEKKEKKDKKKKRKTE